MESLESPGRSTKKICGACTFKGTQPAPHGSLSPWRTGWLMGIWVYKPGPGHRSTTPLGLAPDPCSGQIHLQLLRPVKILYSVITLFSFGCMKGAQMGDSQCKFTWQDQNTVHSIESQRMNMEKERRGTWMCFYSRWLVLAVSPSTRSACVQLVLWKEIIFPTPFLLAETIGGVIQRQWTQEPGICLLGNKWRQPN